MHPAHEDTGQYVMLEACRGNTPVMTTSGVSPSKKKSIIGPPGRSVNRSAVAEPRERGHPLATAVQRLAPGPQLDFGELAEPVSERMSVFGDNRPLPPASMKS